jgi:hypothetical protein
MSKKKQRPKWRSQNGHHVATVTVSAQDHMLSIRRGKREAAKDAGVLGHRSGAGTHGGGKREMNRRDRRSVTVRIHKGRYDD